MVRKKPWLNYKGALNEAEEIERLRELERNKLSYSNKLSYRWALFWLICYGLIGAHKFYIGEKKAGFWFVGIFILIIITLEIADGFLAGDRITLFEIFFINVYWVVIILLSYRPLKTDVDKINKEAMAGG